MGIWALVMLLPLIGFGCRASEPGVLVEIDEGRTELPPWAFSPDRARGHVHRLGELGERASGSAGAARARAYLTRSLDEFCAEVRAIETGDAETPATHLLGIVPGESTDPVILAASYDSPPGSAGRDANAEAASLLVELGRALSARSFPFTLWLVLVDGDAPSMDRGDPQRASRALATSLAEDPLFFRVRAAVFLGPFGGAPRVARDLRSHWAFRDIFWESAADLGEADLFPLDSGYRSPDGAHLSFQSAGLRRVVALTGDFEGASAPPLADPASSTSRVGRVAVEALRRIGDRLGKMDTFAASLGSAPLASPTLLGEPAEGAAGAPSEP